MTPSMQIHDGLELVIFRCNGGCVRIQHERILMKSLSRRSRESDMVRMGQHRLAGVTLCVFRQHGEHFGVRKCVGKTAFNVFIPV